MSSGLTTVDWLNKLQLVCDGTFYNYVNIKYIYIIFLITIYIKNYFLVKQKNYIVTILCKSNMNNSSITLVMWLISDLNDKNNQLYRFKTVMQSKAITLHFYSHF